MYNIKTIELINIIYPYYYPNVSSVKISLMLWHTTLFSIIHVVSRPTQKECAKAIQAT